MNRREIVEALARDRAVERMVENTARGPLTADLRDLSQMVYLILLEYDEDKIVDLYESGALGFFIARVIANQYKSSTSPFYAQVRRYREKASELPQNMTESNDEQ